MGASINAVGNFNFFNPNNATTGAQAQGRTQFTPFERRSSDSASQTTDAQDGGSAADAGVVYELPAGVVLQNQLQGATGANSPAQANLATEATGATAQAPSSKADQGNATQASTNDAATTTQAASSAAATGNATQASTNDAAATTAASSNTSPAVQTEEDQLYAELQSLGLSPAAIQEFMNTAELLAETSPGLFQAFENAVTTLVEPTQASISSSGSGSTANAATAPAINNAAAAATSDATAPATSNATSNADVQVAFAAVEVVSAGSASATPSSGQGNSTANSAPTSNSQYEFATVQVSEAEVEITPASSGQGSAISAAAVSFTATVELSQTAPQTQPSNTSADATSANKTSNSTA